MPTSFTRNSLWQGAIAFLLLLILPACHSSVHAPQQIAATPTSVPLAPTVDPRSFIQTGPATKLPGFTFAPVTLWDASSQALTLSQDEQQASLSNAEDSLYFHLNSEARNNEADSHACLERMLSHLRRDIGNFRADEAVQQNVAGLNADTVAIYGNFLSVSSVGRLTAVLSENRCIYVFGLASTEDSQGLWDRSGQFIHERLLQGLEVTASIPSSCPLANDPAYGTNPDHPIRVGNRQLSDGRVRAETFLRALRGPKLENVTFTRRNPVYNSSGGIVDPYMVEYPGIQAAVILYFDLYSYETPQAPVGFRCEEGFLLTSP